MTASQTEVAAMRRALALAATGRPARPQPARRLRAARGDGAVVAEGYHRGAGAPHAEADALSRAGDAARGATAVVTLEPCNHTGRTGPCADGAGRGRRTTGGRRPARHQPGGHRRRRHPADGRRRRRDRGARGRRPGPEPGLDLRGRARPAVRHLEVRRHPRRPQRRRRRLQPLGLQRSRPRRHPSAPGAVRHDAGRHQHRRRRRPPPHRPRRPTAPRCRDSRSAR